MHVLKSLSRPGKNAEQPDNGRRSFMWKVGAAMSAALASAAPGMAKHRIHEPSGSDPQVDRLSNQLGILEDESAIRKLNNTYETCLDRGLYKEVVDLFAEDGAVVFNGGIFEGKNRGVSRLYCDCFSSGLSGRRLGPVPGFEADTEQQHESIKVAPDRLSARARFPFSIQVGTPMASDSQLVKMARLHGEGILKWCESGIYEISYIKDINRGWKIKRLEYRVFSKTDFRPGRSNARPLSVPLFARTYPENPVGPDSLVTRNG